MATDFRKIIVRRGSGTPPTDLAQGELALDTATNILYIGTGESSPNHYKLVGKITDQGINATDAEINKLAGLDTTAAELLKLHDFTGDKDDLNFAAALNATGVTATEFGHLDNVSSNIQTQINALTVSNEWALHQELNPASNADITIANSDLPSDWDFANYDYKIVLHASTDSVAASFEMLSIQLDSDTTQGRHAWFYLRKRINDSGNYEELSGAEAGTSANNNSTSIRTGLTPAAYSNSTFPANAVSYQTVEFQISRSQIGNSNYVYLVKGEGAIVIGEGDTTTAYTTAASLNVMSTFSGSYGNGPTTLSNIKLSSILDNGTNDDLKIRIYKRER
jgi:hypothetical protein